MNSIAEAKPRLNKGVFSAFEKRVLPAMAERLPNWVTPDLLTAIGILSAAGIGTAYALTTRSLNWLWLANALLIIHWWADSLDGTLARVRKIQREKYGFFVDHISDIVSVFLICIGMGLSPLMDMRVALALIVGYYTMMLLVLMITVARGVFRLSFGGLGPTEVRALLFVINIVVLALNNPIFILGNIHFTLFSLLGFVVAGFLMAIFVISAEIERRHLDVLDPTPQRDIGPVHPHWLRFLFHRHR